MLTFVVGGAASGKSAFAESHVLSLPGRRIYLATMEPYDDECRERIERHRALRREKQFETIERYVDLAGAEIPENTNVLLECMTNLAANERFREDGGGLAAVLAGLDSLLLRCRHLTVVSGEVFSGGAAYAGDTLGYLQDLAQINRELALRADYAVEVVCGLPNVLKEVRA